MSDGALRFYREPWEGQSGHRCCIRFPLHQRTPWVTPTRPTWSAGDSSITLLWFAWRYHARAKPAIWSALWIGSLCVGIYPAVSHVTAGAHAMGDLAMAAAIMAFCTRERLLATLPRPAYAAMFSVLLLSASTSKISLLPLSAVLICLGAWPLLRPSHPKVVGQVAVALATPWIIFYCPIALWTWTNLDLLSGRYLRTHSPSIYSTGWVQETFRSTSLANQPSLMTVIQYIAIVYSSLILLAVIGAIFGTDLSKPTRGILAGILVLQLTPIYWLLPYERDFLVGLIMDW